MEMNIVDRIFDAKKFLQENPKKTMIIVFRIFHFSRSTLQSSINREKTATATSLNRGGGHNKILEDHQIQTVHEFIRRLLIYSIPFIKFLTFNAIRNLKVKEIFFFKIFFSDDFKRDGKHIIYIRSKSNF